MPTCVAASPATVYRVLAGPAASRGGTGPKRQKAQGFQQPLAAPRALACRHQLRQRLRHVLLPRQRTRWVQPVPGPLGITRIDEGVGRRDHVLQRAREKFPDATAPHHHRQRPPVHRQRFQRVHPALGHDPRAGPVPTIRNPTARSSVGTAHSRPIACGPTCRCRSTRPGDWSLPVRRALQSRPSAQRHRLRHARRQARRPRSGDLRRARPQARRRQENVVHNSGGNSPWTIGLAPSTLGTEKRVEGAWGRGASSPPIPETSAAQPLHLTYHRTERPSIFQFTNGPKTKFHFTLNQDISTSYFSSIACMRMYSFG